MKTIKRITKILEIENFKIFCLFNNGETRIIDFERLFKKWKVNKQDFEYPLMESKEEFQKVEVVNGTLAWKNISIVGKDDEGNDTMYFYDLDPIVLYENSELDKLREGTRPQMV